MNSFKKPYCCVLIREWTFHSVRSSFAKKQNVIGSISTRSSFKGYFALLRKLCKPREELKGEGSPFLYLN